MNISSTSDKAPASVQVIVPYSMYSLVSDPSDLCFRVIVLSKDKVEIPNNLGDKCWWCCQTGTQKHYEKTYQKCCMPAYSIMERFEHRESSLFFP